MMFARASKLLVSVLFVGTIVLGCRGETSTEPPITPIRNMHTQDRYNTQMRSQFFADGRTMRPPVEGTIAREMVIDRATATGRTETDDGWVSAAPASVVAGFGGADAMVKRGQQRYEIYCTPCHSSVGDGKGIVQQRSLGSMIPPTFHDDRIRRMPDGQMFATISNGIRNMPGYYAQISAKDRWAIVGYVRALQLSQGAVAQGGAR